MLRLPRIYFGAGLVFCLLLALPCQAQVATAWAASFNAYGDINSEDLVGDMVADGQGNIYLTGQSIADSPVENPRKIPTVKYRPDGTIEWTAFYSGTGGYEPEGSAIAYGPDGSIYVGGVLRANNTINWADMLLIKYNADGSEAWVRIYNGALNENDAVGDIAVDPSGNIYVGGFADQGCITLKYSPDGNLLWASPYSGNGMARAISLDDAGNVYVAGSGNNAAACLKYDPDGNLLWAQNYLPPSGEDRSEFNYAIWRADGLYLGGYIIETGVLKVAMMKCDAAGEMIWNHLYFTPSVVSDQIRGMDVDAEGNAYVTGVTTSGSGNGTLVTIKYYPDGQEAWINSYADDGYPSAVRADGAGNVYVTGYGYGSTSASGFRTLKYDADGNIAWLRIYRCSGDVGSEGRHLYIDPSGDVYVGGYGHRSLLGYDYLLVKYSASELAMGDANADGTVNVGDVISLVNHIFRDKPLPASIENADANCDSRLNVGDAAFMINYIFKKGHPPNCR
jgi:hypothetical protein